jgi:polygalacturonase
MPSAGSFHPVRNPILDEKEITNLEDGGAPTLTRRQTLPALAMAMGSGFLQAHADRADRVAPTVGHRAADRGALVYNIRDYGAMGDGATLDTAALQATVDACAGDGGIVLVPAGTFLIGSIELKTNVTLRLVAGAKLLGSGRGTDYHAADVIPLSGDSTLEDGNWALIYAVNAKNITVEGPGVIDGQGAQFHSPARGVLPPSGLGGNRRPYHLLFYRCEGLRIRDIDLVDCAYHSVRVVQCNRVHFDDIYIHNRVNGNNDGFHFISSEFVSIANCTVKSLDDACALFGSCRNVTVTNCFFSTRWSVFRFGGGIAVNIAVSNCVLRQVYGCPIKFHGAPGSRFENMSFANLVLDDVTGPIHISLGPRTPRTPSGGPTPVDALPVDENLPPAVMRNISFTNIHGTVTTDPQQIEETTLTSHFNPGEKHSAIVLNAVGGATLERISFENIHLVFGGGGTAEDAARRDLPAIAGEYFMLGPIPAYGFYARNARALTLSNIRLETKDADLRPAVVLDHVEDVSATGLSVGADAAVESALRFIETRQVLLTSPRLLSTTKVFLQIRGSNSTEIRLEGGDVRRAANIFAFRDGATHSAVDSNQTPT